MVFLIHTELSSNLDLNSHFVPHRKEDGVTTRLEGWRAKGSLCSRKPPDQHCTQPPMQWVRGFIPGLNNQAMVFITQFHPLSRLRMNGAGPLLLLYTFMVLTGKASLIPPREYSVPIMRTSKLMLHIEIIGVYCGNYAESIHTLCTNMHIFCSVQHVVHIVTTEL